MTEQAPEEVQTETEETAAENSAESTAEVNRTVMETSVDNSTEAEADETVAETVEEDGTGEVTETVETDTAEQSSAVTETSSKESTKIVSEAAAKTNPSEESGYSETVTVDGITVEATAEVGVFPAGTTMTVTLLSADDETADQYSEAEAALEESGIEYDGFVTLDISFFDTDGNQIEPEQGSVTVKMNVEASLLDEDMDTDSLAVQHLAESDNGSIEVQTVADVADETDGTVTVENEAVTAEFEVESFSTYTVTWTSNGQTKKAVLYFYDESGNDISEALGISGSQTVSDTGSLADSGSNGEDGLDVIGKTYNGISGYYYVTAHLDSVEGTTATDISYNNGWHYYSGGWHEWTNSNNSQKTDNTVNVYLIYTKDTLTTVKTVDSESMGITIRMIDYYAAAQLTSGSRSYDSIIGGDYYTNNGGVTQNLLRRVLENDGYSVTANGISLAELFSGGTEVNYLFLESTYEETGYLEYSSFENYAYLGSSSNFTVYEQIGTPSNEESYFYMRGNFMPYNAIVNGGFSTSTNLYDEDGNALTESDDRYDENLYKTQGTNDYEFGMYLEAEFYQPENGQVESAGEMVDMRYEFNGDDDLWVYIDDVLVLDIGGIHDAHSGYIDFATGVVHVELGDIDNDGVADVQNTTIKAMFKEAGVFPDGTACDYSLVNEYFDGDT
ncbi:MAG: hypothetical protein LUG56_10810, partial [Lachnospiraceae bacterium]|nr:hypothetical protein [Lachnospiraceae bacterium]